MDKATRRAAVAAYKERKAQIGVFAVRCTPTGQCWVGTSPNLPAAENRILFALRLGSSLQRTLQAARNEHGPAAFTFEALERLADDVEPVSHARILKARLEHWQDKLRAEVL